MEFNELERLIVKYNVNNTLNQVCTKLGIATKEDRPKNINEKDWTHEIDAARCIFGIYAEGNPYKEKEISFGELKRLNIEFYNLCLTNILKNYNKLGVDF